MGNESQRSSGRCRAANSEARRGRQEMQGTDWSWSKNWEAIESAGRVVN